jgi:hypothetical protein
MPAPTPNLLALADLLHTAGFAGVAGNGHGPSGPAALVRGPVQISASDAWDAVTISRITDDGHAVEWEVTCTLSTPLDAISAVLRVAGVPLVDPTG